MGRVVLRILRVKFGKKFCHINDIAIIFTDPDLLSNNLVIIRRTFQLFFTVYKSKICHISISGQSDLMTLNMYHNDACMRFACTGIIFTKCKVSQPVRSTTLGPRPRYVLLLIRYVCYDPDL